MESLAEDTDTVTGKGALSTDKDESGFEDESACSHEDSLSSIKSDAFLVSVSTPLEKSYQNNCSRQNDSGINCGQKLPFSVQSELTEGDVSEIVNENMADVKQVSENNEVSNQNNHCAKFSKTSNKSENMIEDGDKPDNDVKNEVEKCVDNEVNNKQPDSKCDIKQLNSETPFDDNENNSEEECYENFTAFVKKASKMRSHVRALVDYGNSSSDKETDEESAKTGGGKRNYRKRKQDSDDESDNDLDEIQIESADTENSTGDPVLLRHSQLDDSNVVMSDLDSESSDDETGKMKHDSPGTDSDDSLTFMKDFPPLKHSWKAMHELRSRELGYLPSNRSGLFTRRVQGSLQMVQRFKLQYKMDRHNGCVNALHFNRLGRFEVKNLPIV